ncbi:hypothetical protein GCM10009000_036400 [Halobacterium noricense]
MSRRRPDDDDDEDDDEELAESDEDDEDEEVEYFVDVEEELSVRTSVPKSEQSEHSSSSAPSTFVVVSDAFSAPHISHWGIPRPSAVCGIKRVPPPARSTGI